MTCDKSLNEDCTDGGSIPPASICTVCGEQAFWFGNRDIGNYEDLCNPCYTQTAYSWEEEQMSKRHTNYDVVVKDGQKPIKMWTRGVSIEDVAMQQLHNVASLPFIYRHIAVMPDVHMGWGATIGSVIPTVGAVIPSAVGSDIGCGVAGRQLEEIDKEIVISKAKQLRRDIEKIIPVGFKSHSNRGIKELETKMGDYDVYIDPIVEFIEKKHPDIAKIGRKSLREIIPTQFGTLGGGNHFIEICLDENDCVWVILHTGSRNIGKRISDYFINLAKQNIDRYFIDIPDKDLAYLPQGTEEYEDYMFALNWAQEYAFANREMILDKITTMFLNYSDGLSGRNVNCHHNYAATENHFGKNVLITRKGATRARKGEWAIIPGSMGTNSYIVRGKGNPESFYSCSHGAGRTMGRREAKRRFTVKDLETATVGVECRKDDGILDELPQAYKNIQDVINAQSDLIEVKHTLKQVICVKG